MFIRTPLGGKAGLTAVDYVLAKDEELVGRLLEKDERALERLYDRYGRATYSLVLKMLRDPSRAEEVSQEVFLKLWRRPESYVAGRGAFATWLLSVAHHRAVDELRARRHEVFSLGSDDSPPRELIDDGSDLADGAWVREQRAAVRTALATLPPSQRQAVELAYFAGLTQREISERLGEPLGTVKTRIRLAMQKLRITLTEPDEPAGQSNGVVAAEVRHADV
jgi:RNA polymerase sigma-70 factor (ECF subfamily)